MVCMGKMQLVSCECEKGVRERVKNLSVLPDVVCTSPPSQVLHSYFIIHPTGKCQMFAGARSHLSDILVPSPPSFLPSISIRPPAPVIPSSDALPAVISRGKKFRLRSSMDRDAHGLPSQAWPRHFTKYFVIIFAWNFEFRIELFFCFSV